MDNLKLQEYQPVTQFDTDRLPNLDLNQTGDAVNLCVTNKNSSHQTLPKTHTHLYPQAKGASQKELYILNGQQSY